MGRGGCLRAPQAEQRCATRRESSAADQKTSLSSVTRGSGLVTVPSCGSADPPALSIRYAS
jgi:hypothetical protein